MLSPDLTENQFLDVVNTLLLEGCKSSKSPFHQGTLATVSNNIPQIRTVVLRRWNLVRRSLIFHTDKRSTKVKELQENNRCSLLFYSKQDKLQLRFNCVSHLHYDDRLKDFIFKQTTASQRRCYEQTQAPSSILNTPLSRTLEARENFVVCVCNFTSLDLLFLNYDEHIRVHYNWDKKSICNTTRLAP